MRVQGTNDVWFMSGTSRWRVNLGCPQTLLPCISGPVETTASPSPRHRHSPRPVSLSIYPTFQAMDESKAALQNQLPLGLDATTEEEYASQSNLLREFANISSIDNAWIFNSESGDSSRAKFVLSQPNLLENKKRKFILSSDIVQGSDGDVKFQWAPFPTEMSGISIIVPSPSGSKILALRNPENDSPCKFEIWSQSQLEKEYHIPQSVHGSVYTDKWFEGISWNSYEDAIAYVAEEPAPPKPTFNDWGYKKGASIEKDYSSWKGQGDWEQDWGETYAGKRQPALFVINVNSGEVQAVKGIDKSLSVGQVIWAPPAEGSDQCLVFVGWSFNRRKLGIKYCYNRPCALYAVRVPFYTSKTNQSELKSVSRDDVFVRNLTETISSAFFPRFSPDGKVLVFLSARSSVDSGVHSSTNSLHRIDWPTDGKLQQCGKIHDVVPVVLYAEDGHFPGLYCSSLLNYPWLSDGCTMIISSAWGSCEVLLSVNVLSGDVLKVSPAESSCSWSILALDGDNILAGSSSPIDVPQIKYGSLVKVGSEKTVWNWSEISGPVHKCSEKVSSLLSSLEFSILKIPVKNASDNLTKGARKPYEAIYVCSKATEKKETDACSPLIVVLHGGPHSVSQSSFSKNLAFLSSIGFNLLIVNYRGSLGFGEESLQSLPGNIGTQDVNDVIAAIDHIIDMGLACPTKIAVLGGSHGGFLTTHLIGQAPDKFFAAAARNPVCNLALMVGTTDIPDWCYVESYGTTGKDIYTEAPSADHLTFLHSKSPISHVANVKTPTIFLLGAKDLRVPVSDGLQYARALKEKGVEVKVLVFPNDIHPIDKPQSDFESFLNIGVWFKKHCK